MDFSASSLAAGFIFGVIGMFLIRRGRKEANIASFLIGLGLIGYPYFVANTFALWGIGFGLMVLAYILR